MWKLVFVLALPFVSLAAAHSGEPEGLAPTEATADVQCLIRAKPMAGGVELEGVVVSEVPISGTYQFDVNKAGPAGTSSSAQSGDFEVRSGEEIVGHVRLGLEPGATYEVELVVQWSGGETSCTATGPDRA